MCVCVDGCAARREQMVEAEQPVSEHRADRKGKRGPSCASTQAPSAKTAHSRAPRITRPAFSSAFHCGSLCSLHSGAFKYKAWGCSGYTAQREEPRVGNFSLPSRAAFVYCSVACCGETALKLGSGDKHLGYALNKLSTGSLFQSCLHHKHFSLCWGCLAG